MVNTGWEVPGQRRDPIGQWLGGGNERRERDQRHEHDRQEATHALHYSPRGAPERHGELVFARDVSETDASAQPPGISKPTGRPSRTMSSGSAADRMRNRTRGAFFRRKAT